MLANISDTGEKPNFFCPALTAYSSIYDAEPFLTLPPMILAETAHHTAETNPINAGVDSIADDMCRPNNVANSPTDKPAIATY